MIKIRIFDYGSGNTGSVQKTLTSIGYQAQVITDIKDFNEASVGVIPGVGSAAHVVSSERYLELKEAVVSRKKRGLPTIGICLGAQLFFEHLAESSSPGVGIISGSVDKIKTSLGFNTGWQQLDWYSMHRHGINTGIKPRSTFYFNHGYVMNPSSKNNENIVRTTGPDSVPAIVFSDSICAIQFHPEKSQSVGKRLLKNILENYYGI